MRWVALRGVLLVLLCCSALALSCTQRASWSGEGTEGKACFPDHTCDPGLTCSAEGACVAEPFPPDEDLGATDRTRKRDLGLRDRARPVDRSLVDKPPNICSSTPPTPTVNSYPKSTTFPNAAVKGIAPGAVKLQVTGGAFPQSTSVSGGVFCIEVALTSGTVNTLQLVSVDANGCSSAPIFVDIQQVSSGMVNMAYGLIAKTKRQPDTGQLSYLTDGQLSTITRFSFFDTTASCDENEYLWYDLGASRNVQQVNVRYPKKTGFKYYAFCWALLTSDQTNPVAPDPKHFDWKVIQISNSGTSNDLTVTVGASVRHVALMMFEDGTTGYYETFEIGEMEILGEGQPTTCP